MSRRELMLRESFSDRRRPCRVGLAEFAGGMTAECAAICCCFPCGLLNFLVLAVYKIPVGLCRSALRKKRRRRLIKKGLLPTTRRRCSSGCDEAGVQVRIHPIAETNGLEMKPPEHEESEIASAELEREMWRRFSSAGFWRSPSEREPPSLISVVSDCRTTAIQPISVSSAAF